MPLQQTARYSTDAGNMFPLALYYLRLFHRVAECNLRLGRHMQMQETELYGCLDDCSARTHGNLRLERQCSCAEPFAQVRWQYATKQLEILCISVHFIEIHSVYPQSQLHLNIHRSLITFPAMAWPFETCHTSSCVKSAEGNCL